MHMRRRRGGEKARRANEHRMPEPARGDEQWLVVWRRLEKGRVLQQWLRKRADACGDEATASAPGRTTWPSSPRRSLRTRPRCSHEKWT